MLKIQGLTKIHPGGVTAVQGFDLEIPNGMFGLLGPNGAGKTTLMKMIAGLLEPTSGGVSLGGRDTIADPRQVWDRLGYLPQDFGFYPHLTGEKMLMHLLRLKGVSQPEGTLKELCADLLARVNLTQAAGRKVSAYSGGMRQRLGIAQAIAGSPSLIIVDEPTAGLDPEERLRFYRILAELAEDRIVLLSTHIVEDVAVLCPRFAMIRAGRLIANTTPAAARREVEDRIFQSTVARDRLEEVERTHRVTQSVLVEGHHILRVFLPDGDAPEGFEPVSASLEDAYLVAMQDASNPVEASSTPEPIGVGGAR